MTNTSAKEMFSERHVREQIARQIARRLMGYIPKEAIEKVHEADKRLRQAQAEHQHAINEACDLTMPRDV